MGIERDTDLRNTRVKPAEGTDGGRNFTIQGRVGTDGGGGFLIAEMEDGFCALISEGYVKDHYDIDDSEPDTAATDATDGTVAHDPNEGVV